MRTIRRLTTTATVTFAAAALLGVLSGAAPGGAVRAAAPAYPDSIAAIGHSYATGEGVSGPRAFRIRNSWITGDVAAVQSLYSRILARNPAIRGNKFNLAIGGADAASMLLQARKAVTLKPAPELVVVQGIDNDITCNQTGHRPFQVAFARVLDVLATGLPEARIFVVSQFGSVPSYIASLSLKQRVNQRSRISPVSGPCAFLDARGAAIPKGVAYMEAVIHRYEAAVANACKAVAACRYDGGAFGRIVSRPEYISWDVIHLAAPGQAKSAAVAWAALQRVGIIPSSGRLSLAVYTARAGTICREEMARMSAVGAGLPRTLENMRRVMKQQAAVLRTLRARMSTLRPPERVEPDVGRMLSSYASAAAGLETVSEAEDMADAARRYEERVSPHLARAIQIADSIGIEGCEPG